MKIAIVNSFFPPWRGGAETYVHSLAHELSFRGHDVKVICANEPLAPGTSIEDEISIRRHRLVGRLYGTPIMPGLVEDLFTVDADIFHANFPSPYIAFMTALASYVRGVPAVLTWHNDLPQVTSLASLLIHAHDNLVLPKYIHAYRRIIATSGIYAKESHNLSVLGRLVTVIPNGVDCRRFHPALDSGKLRAKLGLQNKFTFIFVGALTKWHRYKGLDVLLKAMKLMLDQKRILLVVGGGELKEEYQAMSRQLGTGASTLFLGDVADEHLPEYYAAADVLVVPSKDRSEGFGLTVLEANAVGKPVVASNVGGIPSVVRHNYNGLLVPPNDPSALSKALLRLSSNRDLATSMGRNGRKVAEEHDWHKTALLTERVYLEALGKR